ncbi:LacI family DNA-binding transcriptional regulator [Nocardioides aurantiacus]|uniref:LacI family transcriptional regulator n=1 Tax=Nocardioides aurantiacus TaxID=86796 RepID=A0A3N2CXN7_9ACTN|nr:LacI family DNA-binding transcriptional regulator [Nocardioides aurantiacus]ROR92310.1 LacI family transcriptional regulator [Nocardioides aurantiacus]
MTGIKDVATEVGLSTATVSRALRGQPGVSLANRRLVEEAATRLGYVASRTAAGLATGRTRTVAVVVPYVTRWFFAAVIHGAEQVLSERGYDLMLFNLAGSAEARHRVLETHQLSKRADALMILGLQPNEQEQQWLTGHDACVVLVGAHVPLWPSVRIDDHEVSRTALHHLTELGHRRIAYVGGSPEEALDFATPRARHRGYLDTVADLGLDRDPCLDVVGGFTVTGGLAAGHQLLALADRPTAVYCASDEMAIGVLRAARDRGVRVPDELSVIGVDDHEMAEHLDLTTVRQPVVEQGRTAAQQLLGLLDGSPSPPAHVVLDAELVVRGSTGPAPA